MAGPDFTSILAALTQADKAAEASNPFTGLTGTADTARDLLLKHATESNGRGDFGDIALPAIIAGITGGLSKNLGETYQSNQEKLAADSLGGMLTGSVFSRPEGMNQSVFSGMNNVAEAMKIGEEFNKKDATLQTEQAIQQAKALAPIEIEKEVAKIRAQMAAYGGLTPGMLDDAMKQKGMAQDKVKVLETADSLFNQALGIKTVDTLNPLSPASSNMTGIGVALTNLVQKIQGREINEPFRKQLERTLPDWNDTKEQIQSKKELFKEMLSAISPSTPLVSAPGGSVTVPQGDKIDLPGQAPRASQPPAGAIPTNKTSKGKPVFIVNGKFWVAD